MKIKMREVPIYTLEFEDEFIKRYKEGCGDIFASDSLTNGRYVRLFESKFSEFIGAKHSVAVNSGTAALEVALRALNVQGKQVIIPTNTFVATAIAVKRAGADIVLADIEDDTFALSPEVLKKVIHESTAAVIIVHIGGIISKYVKDIIAICEEHRVPLVEDAAHAHGSSQGAFQPGTIGTIGCFSFFPTKVMTTAEGGMVTTNDDELAEAAKSIRNFGRDLSNPLVCINDGANFKMTEFQGLLGVLEMDRVAERVRKRIVLAEEYQKLLAGTSYDAVTADGGTSSYYKQIVKIKGSQDELHEFCKKYGVSLTGEVYRYPVHQQPVFQRDFNYDDFPVANKFSKKHICPPVYPELEIDEVHYVCQILRLAEETHNGSNNEGRKTS